MTDTSFSKISAILYWIRSKSLIEAAFLFRGSKSDFINTLKTTRDLEKKSVRFYLSKLHDDSFQITDVSSIGIALINDTPNLNEKN